MMVSDNGDMSDSLVLDGNVAAGVLYEIFGAEMTLVPAECGSCGNVASVGRLMAFMLGPGLVLRCPACQEVLLRVVHTPTAVHLDMRGIASLRLSRREM